MWLDEDPLKKMKGQFMKAAVDKIEEKKEYESQFSDPKTIKYPKEELIGKFPDGIDPTRKEEYLEEAVFYEIFGMTLAAFKDLKKWK